jgi:hypothetical protein
MPLTTYSPARYAARVTLRLSTTLAAVAILSAAGPLRAQDFAKTPIGALIVQDESGGHNVPNFRYDKHHTAGGKCQMTNETWRRIAPTIDIDLEKFPNAGSASEFQQNQACWKLLATDGVWPWTCCNKQLRDHLNQRPQLVVNQQKGTAGIDDKLNTKAGAVVPRVWHEASGKAGPEIKPHQWYEARSDLKQHEESHE